MAELGRALIPQAWAIFAAQGALSPATFRQYGPPVLDIDTGTWTTPSTARSLDVLVSSYRRQDVDGTVIVQGDMQAICPQTASTPAPDTTDECVIDGDTWRILAVTASGNGGLWVLHLRRPGGP